MDAMEDMDLLSGSNTHLSKLSSECNIMAGASQTKTTFPGLKYRHIGKTGLKVSNIALGKINICTKLKLILHLNVYYLNLL